MFETASERLKYVIEVIMDKTNKTKKSLAEELEISPSALTQLTSGKSKKPSANTLKLLKEKFGINPDWILNGSANSMVDLFISRDGFANLREEIKIINTDEEEKSIVCTINGWARILDYIYNSKEYIKSINPSMLAKVKNWNGLCNQVRPLLGSPVFLNNYEKDDEGKVYSNILFYLEGTPPKGFIIAERINIFLEQDDYDFRDRVLLKCIHIFKESWESISLGGENCFYYITLSHNEYLSIMNKSIPQNYLRTLSKSS